jgi:hypothetical protein
MNKNVKLVLFFAGATVFCIVLLMGMTLLLAFIAMSILKGGNQGLQFGLIIVSFFVAIILTFIVYGRVMRWVAVKFHLEKNIPQLFKKKK